MYVNKEVPGTNTGTEVGNRNSSTAQKRLLEDSAQYKMQCSYHITMKWSYNSDLFKLTLHMLS